MTKPFPGIRYGVQSGSGNSYVTIQKQMAERSDLIFYIYLPFKETKDGKWSWHGPIVQGPPDKRFLYLDIGSYAGQPNALVNGRLKVPLPGLSGESITTKHNGRAFSTTISGTKEKDGKPNFGTVNPFDGWEIVESNVT